MLSSSLNVPFDFDSVQSVSSVCVDSVSCGPVAATQRTLSETEEFVTR